MKEKKKINKYTLSRYIPSPIKRDIRLRCGFGCVICGSAIYEYHHYDPSFSQAKKHDPNKIVLLCGTCHGYITSGIWSEDKIRIAHQNPICLENGFSHGLFDFGNKHPTIIIGNSVFENVSIIFQVFETPILKIDIPESKKGPFRISGIFCDSNGQESFRIIENEWQGSINNWDIEREGSILIIRSGNHRIILRLKVAPPNEFIIEKINMFFKGVSIVGSTTKGFIIKTPNEASLSSFNVSYINTYCAFYITEGSISVAASELPKFKIGRNSSCPCMSGRKYKNCCGKLIR